MANQTTWKLIHLYIIGKCSLEERRRLEKWMAQDPANRKLVLEVKKIWELTPEEEFNVDVENAWSQFSSKFINEDIQRFSNQSEEAQRPSRTLMHVFRAAAVILVSAFAGFFTHAHIGSDDNAEHAAEFYTMQELVTDKQEKARVTFSDGTEVVVNSASTLSFPQKFNGSSREINLDGEAYFKVAHDADRPFIVHTSDATIEVLGTKFNIQAWSEDSNADIVVQEGRVLVASSHEIEEDKAVFLESGEYTSVRRGENPIAAQKVDSEKHLLWTTGGLYFEDSSLSHVFKQIERRFEVDIDIDNNELLEVPFTSTFYEAELSEILNVIAASMELVYYQNESTIHFRDKNL